MSRALYLLVVIWPLQFGPIGVALAQLFHALRYAWGISQSTMSIEPAWNACISRSVLVYSWISSRPEPGERFTTEAAPRVQDVVQLAAARIELGSVEPASTLNVTADVGQ